MMWRDLSTWIVKAATGSVRRQLILGIAVVYALMMSLFVADVMSRQLRLMAQDNMARARSMVQTLSVNSAAWVLSGDLKGAGELINAIASTPGLRYAMILDRSGRVLAHSDPARIGQYVTDPVSIDILQGTPAIHVATLSGLIDASAPVTAAGHAEVIGWVRAGLDQSAQIRARTQLTREAALYILITVLIGTLIATLVGNRLTRRLGRLVEHADALRSGIRLGPLPTAIGDSDLGKLETAFSTMAETIWSREDKLRKLNSAIENSTAGIMITDVSGTIEYVNPAYEQMCGWTQAELLNTRSALLAEHPGDDNSAMWTALRIEGCWSGEVWNRNKRGEIHPELLSVSALIGDDRAITSLVGVFSDISTLRHYEHQLERIAHYDALTGIPNRVLLADRMKQAIAQSQRERSLLAICSLDLDGFKPINDVLGHEAGDHILVEMARRINRSIRGGDTVARLGGDEFVVVLLGLERIEECTATLTRLLENIAEPIMIEDHDFTITASIGVSIFQGVEGDPDALLRNADKAMFVAKEGGKNRFHIFDEAQDRRSREHLESLQRIKSGLKAGEFELFYQPKVNFQKADAIGAEALIRWRHPERGLLPPAVFLPTIENSSVGMDVGDWVIDAAMAQLDTWRRGGLNINISINIAAAHLQSAGFYEQLKAKFARYPDLPPGSLEIEVLETTALEDLPKVAGIIMACHELGVSFALDDFGTGYSSLTYLRHIPAKTLKIDQSFVRDMLEDDGDRSIVAGIIALADAFDLEIVAEGVETRDHFRMLRDMGCHVCQGYAIARPMPAPQFPGWWQKWSQGAQEEMAL